MLDKIAATEALDRSDSDDGADVEYVPPPVAGRHGLLHRFAPQRLTSRIVLLNLLGLVVLVAGILYFNQFRQGLIDARVESLTIQAQIISAAIAGSATADTGSIVINPDSLNDTLDPSNLEADQFDNLDFPINPETTGPVLRRLLANSTIRGRIIDPEGNLVVDSRFLYGGGDIVQSEIKPPETAEGFFLIRWRIKEEYYYADQWHQWKPVAFR